MGCGASAPGDDSQIGGGDMEITQTNHLRVLLLGSSGSGKHKSYRLSKLYNNLSWARVNFQV